MYKESKTNWVPDDYFNIEDYNRIKNNIQWIKDFSTNLYKDYEIIDMGSDATYDGLPYADLINNLEINLETIAHKTIPAAFTGVTVQFSENGNFIDHIELNRLETICKSLHDLLDGQFHGRPRLSFKLNMKGVI
jgi:hypothetical protein